MDAEDEPMSPSADDAASASAGMANSAIERRCHPRYPVDEDSTLLLVSHGLALESHILDLSLEGCRLRTQNPYTAGTHTRVEVSFRVNGIAFRFVGVIQWTDGQHQVGVRFVEMIARRGEQLGEVICEIESATAARATLEAAERAAAESEIEEKTQQQVEEEAEEDARKQAEERAGSEGPDVAEREAREWAKIQEIARRSRLAHTASAPQLPGQEPQKRDRRAQARHHVDSVATIFLIKGGSTLCGHIQDLSMGGCSIRIDERIPLGIYTRVEIEFRLEGLPIRLGGVIQSIRDPYAVGIRFLDLSERKRKQVEQLIAEIGKNEQMRGIGGP